MFKRTALVLALLVSTLSGCATSPEANPNCLKCTASQDQIKQVREQLRDNWRKESARTGLDLALNSQKRYGRIMVGEVGSLIETNKGKMQEAYNAYRKVFTDHYSDLKPDTLEKFEDDMSALVFLEFYGVPLLYTRATPISVPSQMLKEIEFPSTASRILLKTTGDLVMASDYEGELTTIKKVLCKKSLPDFAQCSNQYEKGVFDINTGEELDILAKPIEGGKRIDVTTYKKIAPKS